MLLFAGPSGFPFLAFGKPDSPLFARIPRACVLALLLLSSCACWWLFVLWTCLVCMARPHTALAATGTIWTRWSFVITPVNWNLATANVFVACTGIYQLQRVYRAGRSGTAAAAATEPPPPVRVVSS